MVIIGICFGVVVFLGIHFLVTDWWENASRLDVIRVFGFLGLAAFLIYNGVAG